VVDVDRHLRLPSACRKLRPDFLTTLPAQLQRSINGEPSFDHEGAFLVGSTGSKPISNSLYTAITPFSAPQSSARR
jgi:hypothetical protein